MPKSLEDRQFSTWLRDKINARADKHEVVDWLTEHGVPTEELDTLRTQFVDAEQAKQDALRDQAIADKTRLESYRPVVAREQI